MESIEVLLKDLTGKNEAKATEAARYMVDNSDLNLFKLLVEKSDFLFDFVKNNVCNRIDKVITKDNFENLIKFFEIYSPDYDDLFASILAKNANQNLTDKIFDMLANGTNEQKTYCAKYFYYIPDTVSIELLSRYAFSDDEALAYNSAEALSQMRDDICFDIALNNLNSEDDFEKLKAVKFFVAYGRDYPFREIFEAIRKSKMPENLAGQVPYMVSLAELINSKEKSCGLFVFDCILNGFGEILPLSEIFQFEIFEIIDDLINQNKNHNKHDSLIAEILLKAYLKFSMFEENQEYTFDETKEVKHEISSVAKLLKAQTNDFWELQKHFIIKELKGSKTEILEALPLIGEFCIKEAVPHIKELLNNEDEVVICEALSSLKQLNELTKEDVDSVSAKIHNPNIKAIIDNL